MAKPNPKSPDPKNVKYRTSPNGFHQGESDYDLPDAETENDAKILAEAAKIKSEPNRHQKAVAHLKKKKDAEKAESDPRAGFIAKTGERLKRVFGEDAGEADGGPSYGRGRPMHS
jgi:hypothetical protein